MAALGDNSRFLKTILCFKALAANLLGGSRYIGCPAGLA
jgi:hypothetical protein